MVAIREPRDVIVFEMTGRSDICLRKVGRRGLKGWIEMKYEEEKEIQLRNYLWSQYISFSLPCKPTTY